jgi:hypothetical protein
MNHPISKAVMEKTTTVASYAMQGTIGLGGLLSSEWIMVYVAAFFAAMTFLVNWAYQKRREKREQDQSALDAKYKAAREQREQELHSIQRAVLLGQEAPGAVGQPVDQFGAGDPADPG